MWPNTWPLTQTIRDRRVDALGAVFAAERLHAGDVLADLVAEVDEGLGASAASHPEMVVGEILRRHGLVATPATLRRVRQALCVNLGELITPFPGAAELLAGIKHAGAGCFILSNTTFRDAEMYGRDFDTLGWSRWIDGCITSVDVGAAKPDSRMFHAALNAARQKPESCVMVGNSETADIEPAVAMGMTAILVAIEEPLPSRSRAAACVTDLYQAHDALAHHLSSRSRDTRRRRP